MKGNSIHPTIEKYANISVFCRNVIKSVKESLDFEKGISILDVGCGAGSWIMVYYNLSSPIGNH
jgi:ubiquinone/menaquinone biosynthesis C-methylase UbiE